MRFAAPSPPHPYSLSFSLFAGGARYEAKGATLDGCPLALQLTNALCSLPCLRVCVTCACACVCVSVCVCARWQVLAEKLRLQEALIASEEERLQVAKALIDFQVEHNLAIGDAESLKFELEKRVLELEADVVAREVEEGESRRALGEMATAATSLEGERDSALERAQALAREVAPLREEAERLRAENAEVRGQLQVSPSFPSSFPLPSFLPPP